jgi:hypothetical protein
MLCLPSVTPSAGSPPGYPPFCVQDLTLGIYDGAEHELLTAAVAALPELTRLVLLEHSDGAGAVCQVAAAALARATSAHCPHLATLSLALELDDRDAADDIAALADCRSVRDLAVYAADFPDELEEQGRLVHALAGLPPVQAFRLWLLSPSYDLTAVLAPQTALTALALHTPLHQTAAIHLCRAVACLSSLHSLNLHSCQITLESALALSPAIARLRHLSHLDLSSNGLSDEAACELLQAATASAATLQALDVSGHKMTNFWVHSRAAALVAMLSRLTSLSLCARGRAGLFDCPATRLRTVLACLPHLVTVRVAEVPVDGSPVGITEAMAAEFGFTVHTF